MTDLSIINPGAETGDTTGWTSEVGTVGVKDTTYHSGSYSFVVSTEEADTPYGSFYQDIDIPAGNIDDVDDGLVLATLSAWLKTYSLDDDSGRLVLEAYSSTATKDETTFLSRWQTGSPTWDERDDWTEYSIAKYLPAGTRCLRIQVEGKRAAQLELSVYPDDFVLSLTTPGSTRHDLTITNPGINASATTGWTVSNASYRSTQYSGVPVPCGGYFYGGTANAAATMYQDVSVPESLYDIIDAYGHRSYSDQTPNDGEYLTFHFDAIAGSYNTSDQVKTTITFYDSESASLGTLVSTDKAWSLDWESHTLSVVPPVGTRTIRIHFLFTRTDGSNNDGAITSITAYFIQNPVGTALSTNVFTIASGKVDSNLTDFPVIVRLSDMPSSFWSNVRDDGGNISVRTTAGVPVPQDIIRVDPVSQDGVIAFLASSILSASSNEWHITLVGSDVEILPVTHSMGRNSVWADYEGVYVFGETGGDDRTGNNAMGRIYGDPSLFEIESTSSTDLDSHQGVCWDGTYYYTFNDNAIYKWNTSWTLVDSNTDVIGDTDIVSEPTVNHCGDGCVYNGLLYIPLECYPSDGGYNAHIVVFDVSDLSFVESFDISAQAHEVASIAYCEEDDLLYIVDYDGNNSTIYKYDPSDGSYIGTLTTDKAILNRQGITWWRGFFWISSDDSDETLRVSYSGEVSTGNLAGSSGGLFGQSTAGSYEGIGHTKEALLQLVDPGATERVDVYKPLDIDMGGGGGFYNNTAAAHIRCGVSLLNVFTIGCTVSFDSLGQNRSFLSYWDESSGTSNTYRVTLAFSNTNSSLAVWDTGNSWLLTSPAVDPSVDTPYRVHVVYNGTTNRTIQVNAGSKNTDTTITQAPANRDTLLVGAEDGSFAECLAGYVGFLYLRGEVLSDDWIQAEYDMLNDPSSFYSIAASGWTGKICGVTNPSKICGIAVADIAKVSGI